MNNQDMPANAIFNSNGYVTSSGGEHRTGLTKLEYAAIHIAVGIAANPEFFSVEGNHFVNAAEDSVRMAKALFKELEKQNG